MKTEEGDQGGVDVVGDEGDEGRRGWWVGEGKCEVFRSRVKMFQISS